MLKEVYGEQTMPCGTIGSERGRMTWRMSQDLDDSQQRDLMPTSRGSMNLCRLTTRMIAEELGFNKVYEDHLGVENLGMQKVCAEMVPMLLSKNHKTHCVDVSHNIIQQLHDNPKFLDDIITGKEIWVFHYDLETKWQSIQWKTPVSPVPKKACMSKTKVMPIAFFSHQGLVHNEFVLEEPTMN